MIEWCCKYRNLYDDDIWVLYVYQVFHNCSCVSSSYPAGSTMSVRLGQCPHAKDCSRSFTSYMAVSVLSFFISSLGAIPSYMLLIRSVNPRMR